MSTKVFKTTAERSGITSVKAKVKEIKAVLDVVEPKIVKSRRTKSVVASSVEDPSVELMKPVRKKRVITDEQREILSQRLVKARAARVEKRLALVPEEN